MRRAPGVCQHRRTALSLCCSLVVAVLVGRDGLCVVRVSHGCCGACGAKGPRWGQRGAAAVRVGALRAALWPLLAKLRRGSTPKAIRGVLGAAAAAVTRPVPLVPRTACAGHPTSVAHGIGQAFQACAEPDYARVIHSCTLDGRRRKLAARLRGGAGAPHKPCALRRRLCQTIWSPLSMSIRGRDFARELPLVTRGLKLDLASVEWPSIKRRGSLNTDSLAGLIGNGSRRCGDGVRCLFLGPVGPRKVTPRQTIAKAMIFTAALWPPRPRGRCAPAARRAPSRRSGARSRAQG